MDASLLKLCTDVFKSKGKFFYPSFSTFLNNIRDTIRKDFSDEKQLKLWFKDYFPHIENWYFSQEIVQIFSPPPVITSLQNKDGFYPKIISFYPFERLYVDTAFINLFDKTRKQAKKEAKTNIVVDTPVIDKPVDKPVIDKPVIDKPVVDKPVYNGKYPQYISVMQTKKGSNKWVYYINKTKAKKLGLKFQDYRGSIDYLEKLIDDSLK